MAASRNRIVVAMLCFAVGGTLALAEFINAMAHFAPDTPTFESFGTLLLHSGLFVVGGVLIAVGCLALSED